MPLLIRDHEAQRSFRSGKWLPVTPICEQYHTFCKRRIEFWQRKDHTIVIGCLDQQVYGHVAPA
jgi:hypothetical protein